MDVQGKRLAIADALGIADARLTLTTYLDNSGEASSGETAITVKAYAAQTNLLIATDTTSVGVINVICSEGLS